MSALIFVALAGAWAVYLVPKALKQHEDADATRSVESFSERLRVLNPRTAAATTSGSDKGETLAPAQAEQAVEQPDAGVDEVPEDEYVLEPVRLTPVQLRLRRAAARRAAAKRRRVLTSLVLALVVVTAVALTGRIAAAWIAAPLVVIVAWLVACRLMVKKETAARTRVVKKRRTTLADQAIAAEDEMATDDTPAEETPSEEVAEAADGTEEIPALGPASASTWEPVPMTLPTYVAKAPAARTVRTIDLDSTGVWSSGRNADDSELAREAETSRRAERAEAESAEAAEARRAAGS